MHQAGLSLCCLRFEPSTSLIQITSNSLSHLHLIPGIRINETKPHLFSVLKLRYHSRIQTLDKDLMMVEADRNLLPNNVNQ